MKTKEFLSGLLKINVIILNLSFWIALFGLISFCSKRAEAISLERGCPQSFFTASSYLKELLDNKHYIIAFRFARTEANKDNPEPEILLKLSELYAKGLGTTKNKIKANYYMNRYFQVMGIDSRR